MGIENFLHFDGDDRPGTMTWLSNHCMWFAGCDDGTSTAEYLGELFFKKEFESALLVEDEEARQSTIRALAQKCFDEFWERLGVPAELVE